MSRALLLLLAGAMLAAPAPADAQSRWREQVNSQLDQLGKVLRKLGYQRTDTYDGSLNKDATESLTMSVRAGRQYAVLAVCDNDCADIDLHIYGENDKLIDSDVEGDDKPTLTVSPQADGKFRVKITMAQCTTSPCFYGVGLYAK